MHENPCTVLIPLCKYNLHLPLCSSFFICPILGCLLLCLSCCCACSLAVLRWFFCLFVCFYRNRFCRPAINQISLSQSKGWFPFMLLCRWEKYHWTGPLSLYINYLNTISELHQHVYSLKNYLNVINIAWSLVQTHIYGKLIWLNKNIFHWRIETSFKACVHYFLSNFSWHGPPPAWGVRGVKNF